MSFPLAVFYCLAMGCLSDPCQASSCFIPWPPPPAENNQTPCHTLLHGLHFLRPTVRPHDISLQLPSTDAGCVLALRARTNRARVRRARLRVARLVLREVKGLLPAGVSDLRIRLRVLAGRTLFAHAGSRSRDAFAGGVCRNPGCAMKESVHLCAYCNFKRQMCACVILCVCLRCSLLHCYLINWKPLSTSSFSTTPQQLSW